MWTIGIRLMQHRDTAEVKKEDLGDRHYQADLVVTPNSPLIGAIVAKSPIGENSGLTVVKILRRGAPLKNSRNVKLKSEDEIVVEGRRADVLKVKDIKGIELKADVHLADSEVEPEKLAIVEGVLLPNSQLIGRTLKSSEFMTATACRFWGSTARASQRPGN